MSFQWGCARRGQGAQRTFMTSLEAVLAELGVKQLVVASITSLKTMWRGSFGCRPLTVDEAALVEEHLVSPDPETCVMMRKPLGAQVRLLPCALAGGSRTLRSAASANAPADAASCNARVKLNHLAENTGDSVDSPTRACRRRWRTRWRRA